MQFKSRTIPFDPVIVLAILVGFVSILPILGLTYDRWDGVIISDFLETRTFETVRIWFIEGQGPMTLAMLWIADQINELIPLFNWSRLSAFGSVLALIGIWHAAKTLEIERVGALAAVTIVALIPLSTLPASSMNGVIDIAIGLALLGFAAFHSKNRVLQALGLVLMVISIETQSNAVLLAGLLSIVGFKGVWFQKERPDKQIIGVATIFIALYVLYYQIFEATGVYSNYNKFEIADLFSAPFNLLSSNFTLSFILPFCLFMSVPLFFIARHQDGRALLLKRAWLIIALIGLSFAVAIPYAMVGKGPPSYNVFALLGGSNDRFLLHNNPHYRHADLTVICLALAFGSVVSLALSARRRALTAAAASLLILVGLFIPTTMLAWQVIHARDAEVKTLVSRLDLPAIDQLDVCEIDIEPYPNLFANRARFYELNHYAGLAGSNRSTLLMQAGQPKRRTETAVKLTCRSPSHHYKHGTPNIDCEALEIALEDDFVTPKCPMLELPGQ